MSVDLSGAADLHVHFGPDAHRARSVGAVDAAREAADASHAAIVLKCHDQPTAQLARIVDDMVDGVQVFGGICCDREIGGLNPAAVEAALRLGARIVWLPTLSSEQDQHNGIGELLGIPGPGIRVTDDDGALLAATHEILDLVAAHDAVLATGHVSTTEHFAIARAFGRRGRLLVTHAMEELAGPNLTADECQELAELGASIELCALTCVGAFATRSPADLMACIAKVGISQVTLATDFGQAQNAHPASGLQTYADALYAEGMTETDIRRMACENPLSLLLHDAS